MIKSIIFDMDGTLFSTEPIYFECYQAAAKPMGLDFTFELFESCIGVSAADSAPLMKSYFGRKYVQEADLKQYQVNAGWHGMLMII